MPTSQRTEGKYPSLEELTESQFDKLQTIAENQKRKMTDYALYREKDDSIVAFDAYDEEHWLGE